jgi:hypothetical protein
MSPSDFDNDQRVVCARYGVTWHPAPSHLKVGVARSVRSSIVPVNGLRHPPEHGTTGWYIWAGEGDPSTAPDFFVPLHVEHLLEWRPEILKFLGLPPGWRFLTDGTHHDAWEDPTLLQI